MLKKICSFLSAAVVLSSFSAFAAEPKEAVLVKDAYAIKINGGYISENALYDYETGIDYLPLRAVFEALGSEVKWNGDTRIIEISSNVGENAEQTGKYEKTTYSYINASVYPDSVIIKVDGKPVTASTFILNDSTYIEAGGISDFIGHIYADASTLTLRIYSNDYKKLSDGVAAVYGNGQTLTYPQFFDLAKFMYGDFETAKSQNFAEIDGYLLFNEAVKNISDDLNIEVSEEEIKSFSEANNTEAVISERSIDDKEFFNNEVIRDYTLRDKIVSLEKKDLYDPTDEELSAWYENTGESKGIWLQAQHILVSKGENGEGLEKAKALLEEVKKDGADFEKIMLENSQDPGSISTPEGYVFTEGQMVDEFYNASLSLKVGEISDIVETDYGYHIIKKINHWENGIPLNEIKDKVKEAYNDSLFGEKLYGYAIDSDVFYINSDIISKYNESNAKE